ncbi:hypothetical protein MMC31_007617 [Peltigera leucophlebia]|nr:hypothetical protein [Peltigera leucophlebia]
MGQLLTALMGHQVASEFTLKNSNRDVYTELQDIYKKLARGSFSYEHFCPLSQLVLVKAPDVDIWSAVLNLIKTLSYISPPTSVVALSDGTPITRSSASHQGDDQTKKLLEEAIFYEIKERTYGNVGGFFKKYFVGKEWTKESRKIYKVMKKRHVRGQWKDLPSPPTQGKVRKWLSDFQKEFLSNTQSEYFTSENCSDFTGAEAKRQLDFFVKRKSDAASTRHDWKDILVIGEHKQSQSDFKSLLLQLSRYMRDVFAAQPTRRFVHGFFLHDTTMELWVFDRSGPYSSGEFNIHKEPERFICAIAGYALMNNEELGLDTFIEQNGEDQFITIIDNMTGKKKELQLERQPFVKQRAIVCRGTTCYRTSDQEIVVKFSWTSDKRSPEANYLNLARERGVTGLASLLGHHQITSIKELRNGLEFPAAHRFRTSSITSHSISKSQPPRSFGTFRHFSITEGTSKKRSSTTPDNRQSKKSKSSGQNSSLNQEHQATELVKDAGTISLYDSGTEAFDNRLLGCLAISPAGRALSDFRTIEELLTAFRDSIKAHSSLYLKGKILHRDISENNIIITDPKKANGFTGMLIDVDLAKEIGSGRTGARHQTGTMEFMSIQVLRKVAHTYRHDLESFFYVLLWICARRVWEKEFRCNLKDRPKSDILTSWYTGDFNAIARSKEHNMGVNGFKELLKEFPPVLDCTKPLCEEIREILFPYKKGLLVGTPPGPPENLYKPIIKAFDKAIASIAAGKDLQ